MTSPGPILASTRFGVGAAPACRRGGRPRCTVALVVAGLLAPLTAIGTDATDPAEAARAAKRDGGGQATGRGSGDGGVAGSGGARPRKTPPPADGRESTRDGAGDIDPERLQLAVGQAQVIREAGVRRIVVGSGRVIQVTALDGRQVLILAEAAGQSSIQLWGARGILRRFEVTVAERDTARIASEVAAMLGPTARVSSRVVGDHVILEGDHPSEDEVARIAEIQKRHPQVVSLVARAGFERMVRMEVRMLEIGRNALERLGVQWQSGRGTPYAIEGPSFGLIGDFKRSSAFQPGGAAELDGIPVRPRISPFATAATLATSLTSMIDLLVQNGDAAILAEPRLSCRSGGSARFVAGGELPIPVIAANGAASVQFKEYGVRFEVSPVVNPAGMISATLQAEISSINPEVRVRDIPGLRKQSASTQVNLVEGQTLVIAGMLSNEISGSIDKVPALGDLPVLGRLFRSRRFQDRETEMVVLITPRLQEDVVATDTEQARQLDERYRGLRRARAMEE